MIRRILASFLSMLLVLMLVLPNVGAESAKQLSPTAEKKITSKLLDEQRALKGTELDQQGSFERNQPNSKTFDAKQGLRSEELKIESTDGSDVTATVPENYVPSSDSQGTISVIVELQATPVKVFEAQSSKQKSYSAVKPQESVIKDEHLAFKSDAVAKLPVSITHEYSEVFNGFALTIPANQVKELLTIKGVKAVYPDKTVYATDEDSVSVMMDRSAPHIGAPVAWDLGIKGTGVKVGIIDTGMAKDHPDLAPAIAQGDYWGYDFVNNDNDPSETTKKDYEEAKALDPSLPEVNDKGRPYWTSHGSHVGGTVAGRGVGVNGQQGITGVAPEASLYAYKVLGPYGSGSSSNVIAAIDRSVKDGMEVINLSLGSESNNQQAADSVALNNAMTAGVMVVVSAGNSGPGDATMTDPGTSELALTVGASKPPLATPIMKVEEISGSQYYMDSFDKSTGIENLTGRYELVDVGLGKAEDYAGIDMSGKIAFIKRGEIAFTDKALNAIQSGAIGAVVYNNSPETLESGTLGTVDVTIPIYTLSGTYGESIKAAMSTQTLHTSFSTTIESDIMASFSSRGPAKPSYAIKPDISAPGIGIVSSVPDYEGWYESNNGTSMAAPHMAGAAALIKQKYPTLNTYEIKSLLMNNTVKMNDRNGNRYTHMDQGAGRVALDHVLQAKAVATVEESTSAVSGGADTTYYTGGVSFGYVAAGETASRNIEVKDIVGSGSNYSVDVKWYNEAPGNLNSSMAQVHVPAGSSDSFSVQLDVAADAAEARYEGEIILTETGGHVIQLPVAVYVGTMTQTDPVTNLALTPDIFSPNSDGIQDKSDITFNVTESLGYFSLDIYDASSKWIGTLVEQGINPGSYALRGWNGSGLPDGMYLMVPWAGSSSTTAVPLESQLALFIIDNGAPAVNLNDPKITIDEASMTGSIAGQVTSDLLIDLLVKPGDFTMDEMIGVAALYQDEAGWQQVDGMIENNGNFKIDVPIKLGDNIFEVYVYDAAGNGLIVPADVVNYNFASDPVLTVSPLTLSLEEGTTQQLSVLYKDGAGDEQDVAASASYSVKNPELLTVTNGLVTALQAGTTQIEVAYENLTTTVDVTVTKKPIVEQLIVTPANVTLKIGESQQLQVTYIGKDGKAKDVTRLATFKSKDTRTAIVILDRVIGVKEGTTQVEVSYNQLKSNAQVTVRNWFNLPVSKPKLIATPDQLQLRAGESQKLNVIYKGEDGKDTDVSELATYHVKDQDKVAVVNGVVTAVAAGDTKIDITYSNLKVTVHVKVKNPAIQPQLTVAPESLFLKTGEWKDLKVLYTDEDGKTSDVTVFAKYEVKNSKVAVASFGKVIALKEGTTQIAISYKQLNANVDVSVKGWFNSSSEIDAADEIETADVNPSVEASTTQKESEQQ
ncbi:S8 family serine peptidase [Paenibacillus sp. GCM10028914]|uniref:S8 family serine peptidase n=1 Tax=Paenibacillus sp. GCM10028914 TaxID=3273416 RepID=UPI0036082E5D